MANRFDRFLDALPKPVQRFASALGIEKGKAPEVAAKGGAGAVSPPSSKKGKWSSELSNSGATGTVVYRSKKDEEKAEQFARDYQEMRKSSESDAVAKTSESLASTMPASLARVFEPPKPKTPPVEIAQGLTSTATKLGATAKHPQKQEFLSEMRKLTNITVEMNAIANSKGSAKEALEDQRFRDLAKKAKEAHSKMNNLASEAGKAGWEVTKADREGMLAANYSYESVRFGHGDGVTKAKAEVASVAAPKPVPPV